MMDNEINYITPKGMQRLIDERDHLLKKERPEVCKVIAWAAGNGDRSENADYIYGKRRLQEIDNRLQFLSDRIDKARVVDPTKINTDKVQFGATLKIVDEDGIEKTISIVGGDEIDSKKGYISWKSPIGRAMIGKEVGDVVSVTTPKGEIEYEILEIAYRELEIEGFVCE